MSPINKYILTPYQGKKRCFGHYACVLCNKKWTSAYSWANMYQICKDCNNLVYPYKQYPLQPSKKKNTKNASHIQGLCGKCRWLPTHMACHVYKLEVNALPTSIILDVGRCIDA